MNIMRSTRRGLVALAAVIVAAAFGRPASAQFTVPSDGSDGVLNVTTGDVEIDLGLAATGSWDTYSNGNGIYDPEQWIVVFKYQSVNIAPGRTVRFKNHPKNAPVVWLVQGEVRIDGTVDLSGATGINEAGLYAPGGPGGFRGGRAPFDGVMSGGFGPGAPASNVTLSYGNGYCFPLIGGSGGRSLDYAGWRAGSGGGGAILIASPSAMTGQGGVRANGGGGWGSGGGGMVRLVAPSISLGFVTASGAGANGWGRIRVEADQVSIAAPAPGYSAAPLPSTLTFLRHSGTPSVRIVSVGGVSISPDPAAGFAVPGVDAILASAAVQVVLECTNVPPDATVQVFLRSAQNTSASIVTASFQSGNIGLSTWVASGDLATTSGFATVQAKATLP